MEECAVVSRRESVLAPPSPLAEAAPVQHQVILLSWVELRRRARAQVFVPDRCEARLPPPTLHARLSPDSDGAPVDLMKLESSTHNKH